MLVLALIKPYSILGAVVIIVIAAALLARYLIKKRIKKNHLASYLDADFSIAFIPRDSSQK